MKPATGENLVLGFDRSKNLVLDFAPSATTVSRHEGGLVFSLENDSSVTVANFFDGKNHSSTFVLPDGTRVAPEEFWTKFGPEPAPDQHPEEILTQASTDTTEDGANMGDLLEGVSRLGALGSLYWGGIPGDQEEDVEEAPSAREGFSGVSSAGGGSLPYLRAYDNSAVLTWQTNEESTTVAATATGNVISDSLNGLSGNDSSGNGLGNGLGNGDTSGSPANAAHQETGTDHHSSGLSFSVTRFFLGGEWHEANGESLRWEDANGAQYEFRLNADGEYHFTIKGPESISLSALDIIYEIRSEDGLTDQACLFLNAPERPFEAGSLQEELLLTDNGLDGIEILLDDPDELHSLLEIDNLALSSQEDMLRLDVTENSGEALKFDVLLQPGEFEPHAADYQDVSGSTEGMERALLQMMIAGLG